MGSCFGTHFNTEGADSNSHFGQARSTTVITGLVPGMTKFDVRRQNENYWGAAVLEDTEIS